MIHGSFPIITKTIYRKIYFYKNKIQEALLSATMFLFFLRFVYIFNNIFYVAEVLSLNKIIIIPAGRKKNLFSLCHPENFHKVKNRI